MLSGAGPDKDDGSLDSHKIERSHSSTIGSLDSGISGTVNDIVEID